MAKISIFPDEKIKIKSGNTYVYFSDVKDGDDTLDIGDNTNIQLKAAFSEYCPNAGDTSCTYNIFDDSISAQQFDSIFREYTVTYEDENGCKSSQKFKMCDKVFTRPIDEVTSDHPKGITKSSNKTKYNLWWTDNPTQSAETEYWDEDSAFVTTTAYGECQGVCNGFELSSNVFVEFYSATTDVTDAGVHGRGLPWSDVVWTRVQNIEDWWCHPIIIEDNKTGFNVTTADCQSGQASKEYYCTDIRGTGKYSEDKNIHEDNCYGLYYPCRSELWAIANRRSKIRYGADAYNGPDTYRLGKLVVRLSDSMDAFSSLGGVPGSIGEESLRACRCIIDSHDDLTYTAHDPSLSPSDPNYSFTGNVIHFMSPVEVYFFQKKEGEITTTYTYTVYSDVNGATVTWSGGASGTATITSGKATTTNTTGQPVVATLSYGSTQFTNNGATINPNGSRTINKVSTTFLFTVYSDVDGAAVSWSNGATGTISSGYHQISTTTNSSLTCSLTKLGVTFNNNGTGTCAPNSTVTINRYVPSTVYAFTVFSDVEGASVTWRNASTSQIVGTGTISNGTHVLMLGSNNTLTCTLSKSGVMFDGNNGKTCAAGGGIRINRYVEPCTFDVSISKSTLEPSTSSHQIGTYSVAGSCAGSTPTVSFVNDGGVDFVRIVAQNNTIFAAYSSNPSSVSSRRGTYRLTVNGSSESFTLTQPPYNSCANVPAPDFSPQRFVIDSSNPPANLQAEFTSSCWKINSITLVSNPQNYSFVSASHAVIGDGRNIISIYPKGGQNGYSATISANLSSTDGTGRTATKKIYVNWI